MSINFTKFSNGVVVVNTTPHAITMQSPEGNIISVPSDPELILNAKATEQQVSALFVKTVFAGTEQGNALIESITAEFNKNFCNGETLVIVGSIIAAQAYPGKVFGLTPVPGFERVAPTEKRMRSDKFTVF